jgi:hypothetical protein
MSKPPTCRYDAERGWLTPEHLRDCDDRECAGCRPCPKSHCDLLGRCPNHVEQAAGIFTCPSCIGKVKRTVRRIVERYAELPDEVEAKGVDSEALNLHGPAASAEQLAARRRYDAGRGWCDFPRTLADDDPHHPYAVLGRWDMAMRESYGPPTDLFVTVARAADYLTGPVLERFAHTAEFEDFARDVARCLTHLETVLSDSREPEKGAPCPTCRDEGVAYGAPRLRKRYGADVTGKDDTWHCPANPAHWWSDADYRARVEGDYLRHAGALTADQAAERFGIKASVVRVWGAREQVRKRGRDQHGITLYDVADIETRCADRGEVLAPTAGEV